MGAMGLMFIEVGPLAWPALPMFCCFQMAGHLPYLERQCHCLEEGRSLRGSAGSPAGCRESMGLARESGCGCRQSLAELVFQHPQ